MIDRQFLDTLRMLRDCGGVVVASAEHAGLLRLVGRDVAEIKPHSFEARRYSLTYRGQRLARTILK